MLKPNFLYIGTSKAGSTWIYNLLRKHPEIFMAAGKGAYYFDNHFDKGEQWYLDHFRNANGVKIRGEVSHSYMYSLDACRRIRQMNQQMKLMACLRNPIDRAFSAYLDSVKNRRFQGTFEQALEANPSFIERGRYATALRHYLESFDRANLHVACFDDLTSRPEVFAEQIFEFLEVDPLADSNLDLRIRMPAGLPRSVVITSAAKRAAGFAKRLGMQRFIGSAKTSVALRNLLYRPFSSGDRPQMQPETRDYLRDVFREEIRQLDQLIGLQMSQRWMLD